MKTIHISDELWKRLKLESVECGVRMRDVVEEMGHAWQPRMVIEQAVPVTARRGAVEVVPEVRELVVELEE